MLPFMLLVSALQITNICLGSFSTPPQITQLPTQTPYGRATSPQVLHQNVSPLSGSFTHDSARKSNSSRKSTSPFQPLIDAHTQHEAEITQLKQRIFDLEMQNANLGKTVTTLFMTLAAKLEADATTEKASVAQDEASERSKFFPNANRAEVMLKRQQLANGLLKNPMCNQFATFKCPISGHSFDLETLDTDTEDTE